MGEPVDGRVVVRNVGALVGTAVGAAVGRGGGVKTTVSLSPQPISDVSSAATVAVAWKEGSPQRLISVFSETQTSPPGNSSTPTISFMFSGSPLMSSAAPEMVIGTVPSLAVQVSKVMLFIQYSLEPSKQTKPANSMAPKMSVVEIPFREHPV